MPYADFAPHIPAALTARADAADLIAEAEADVIAYYTQAHPDRYGVHEAHLGAHVRTGYENMGLADGASVRLRYYEADAADIDTTDAQAVAFRAALGQTIIAVANHRGAVRDTGGRLVTSESRGRRSITYTKTLGESADWPAGWMRRLRPYDLRPPLAVI